MKNASILETIEKKLGNFSKSQQKLAEYIIKNYSKLDSMTAKELGTAVGVSESTVVRFACELGFDGYTELEKELKSSRKRTLTTPQRIRLDNDGLTVDSVMQNDIECLKKTLSSLDREALEKTIETLLGAKHIYIIGNRTSASLAQFLYLYLELVLDNVKLIRSNSGNEIFEEMLRISDGDVLVAISFPRYSRRTVDAVRFAANRGADVVVLTDSADSSVARDATFVLEAKNDMASIVDSLVAPMSLLNVIIAAVCKKKREELERAFCELEEIWDEYKTFDK